MMELSFRGFFATDSFTDWSIQTAIIRVFKYASLHVFRWTFLRLSSVCCCFCFIVRDVLLLFFCSHFLYRRAWYHSVVVNSSIAFFVYTQNTFTCNVLSPLGLEVGEVTILRGSQVPDNSIFKAHRPRFSGESLRNPELAIYRWKAVCYWV